jgi:Restriction endonuclease
MANRIFISHSANADPQLIQTIASAAFSAGFVVAEPNIKDISPSDIVSSRYSDVITSDATVAVLDQLRPNVLIELGMAMGAGRDVLIVVIDPSLEVPADLRSVPFVQLPPGTAEAETVLRKAFIRLGERHTSNIEIVSTHALRKLLDRPSELYTLSPRQFEELVADIFREFGYEVEIAQRGMDAGCDLIARSVDGRALFVIEAKRYSPQQRVSVEAVRQLYGIAGLSNATAGLLVTTSRFTPSALEFARKTRPPIRLLSAEELLRFHNGTDVAAYLAGA